MTDFVLTASAEADVREIFRFSRRSWGEAQAQDYVMGLFSTFQLLAENPKAGRMRNELSENLRSFPHRIHVVFYVEHEHSVAIIRVLHGARDLSQAVGFE